ncbi:cyclic nucleotide-binding protein [Phyllobacterium sp. 628]|uniref:Acb2/Tad1 domain-containing protein n=1 Tax=Phyllobacterium sp. 628 TaxID=2718938 RepID=UPI00166236FB|nr:cyclic nucleotide-binding protein [Phyllobacterium sp. 628]QND53434.1 cyclic nucleotide-binding protein [Phyllobacterium sp. 628]
MTEHKGLPVAGYKAQSDKAVALVNENKILEERCLRQIDAMNKHNMDAEAAGIAKSGQYDPRMMALARTGIQEAFMWMNRAVFQPDRIKLPEDAE